MLCACNFSFLEKHCSERISFHSALITERNKSLQVMDEDNRTLDEQFWSLVNHPLGKKTKWITELRDKTNNFYGLPLMRDEPKLFLIKTLKVLIEKVTINLE